MSVELRLVNFELSPEQKEVVSASDLRLMVVAAAGAGKTRVLVERYLRHVLEGECKPDEILTITFTKKAAAEMKGRIVEALRAKGLFLEAQVAETGPIQTIHSFCERLLRENALEAGLDPKYEILDEAQAARLVAECVREALSSPLDEEPEAEALVSFLAGQPRYGDRSSPYAMLEAAVDSVLRELRGSGFEQRKVREWHESPAKLKERWEEAIVRELPDTIRHVLAGVEAPSFQESLQHAFKTATNRVPAWLRGKPDAAVEDETLRHTCGLVQLACAAWWRFDREMEARQALDFTELEARAVRLIDRSPVTQERVRAQYKVVMVDEAQDVNPIQYRLLDHLGVGREMRVGDHQQSIYGFRQADVRLFQDRVREGTPRWLTRNFRSEQGILNFVDIVFGNLWGEEYQPMNRRGFDVDDISLPTCEGVEIWKQAAKDTNATAMYVQELIEEGTRQGDICVLVRDGIGALEIQRGLGRIGIENRIAGGSERFYTRIEVRDLANALRSVADPHDDFALLACLRSPVVGVSLDAVALLGLGARHQSVVEQLEQFVSPVAEDQARLQAFREWYDPLRAYGDRLSAWEVLAQVFAQSDYLAAIAKRENGAQLLANARKLLTLAAREPELGPLEFADRVREIQDLRHKEGDAPAGAEDADLVTIMTIHKAKGLEFPVVVLPQTLRSLLPSKRDLAAEPRLGLVATRFGKGEALFYKYLSDLQKERGRAEELRVLYVAMTRARKKLCISLYPPTAGDTASKRLQTILGETPPPGVRVRTSQELGD